MRVRVYIGPMLRLYVCRVPRVCLNLLMFVCDVVCVDIYIIHLVWVCMRLGFTWVHVAFACVSRTSCLFEFTCVCV
jgi:hypothetical protein